MTEQEEFVDESAETPPSSNSSWFGQVIGWLARLLLVAALGIALGVGLYLGVPALLQAWMEPVEANTARISQLERDLDQLQAAQSDALDSVAGRVAALEGETTGQRENLSELESELTSSQEDLDAVKAQLDQVDRLSDQLAQLDQVVTELETDVGDLLDEQGEPSDELRAFQDQITQLRVMTLLSRARLELLRGNYGLAQENLELARSEYDDQLIIQGSQVVAVIERLDLALEALPDSPAVAAQDLEAAWRLLADIDTVDTLN